MRRPPTPNRCLPGLCWSRRILRWYALCPLEATRIRLVSEPTYANGLIGGFSRCWRMRVLVLSTWFRTYLVQAVSPLCNSGPTCLTQKGFPTPHSSTSCWIPPMSPLAYVGSETRRIREPPKRQSAISAKILRDQQRPGRQRFGCWSRLISEDVDRCCLKSSYPPNLECALEEIPSSSGTKTGQESTKNLLATVCRKPQWDLCYMFSGRVVFWSDAAEALAGRERAKISGIAREEGPLTHQRVEAPWVTATSRWHQTRRIGSRVGTAELFGVFATTFWTTASTFVEPVEVDRRCHLIMYVWWVRREKEKEKAYWLIEWEMGRR